MAEEEKQIIEVTHITVRQSISLLFFKLVLLDILAALLAIIFFSATSYSNTTSETSIVFRESVFYFSALVVVKISLTIFIILQWLNEYYEISTTGVAHKSGLIFRKEDHKAFSEIESVAVDQGALGKLFNFGTINLYAYRERTYATLYLIHNPIKYYKILDKLLPETSKKKNVLREHLLVNEIDEE